MEGLGYQVFGPLFLVGLLILGSVLDMIGVKVHSTLQPEGHNVLPKEKAHVS